MAEESDSEGDRLRNAYLYGDSSDNSSRNDSSESSSSQDGAQRDDMYLTILGLLSYLVALCPNLLRQWEFAHVPQVQQLGLILARVAQTWDVCEIRDVCIREQAMRIRQLETSLKRMESALQQQIPAAISCHNQEMLDLLHFQDQQIRSLTSELHELQQENEMMAERIHQQLEPNLQICKQQSELLRIETEVARGHEIHIADLVEEMNALKSRLLTVEEERETISKTCLTHEATIEKMKLQRDEITMELVNMKEERNKLSQTNEEHEKEIVRLNVQVYSLSAEMKELKDKNCQMMKQNEETVATLTREKEQLTLDVKGHKEDDSQLITTCKTQEQEMAELIKKVKQLKEEKEEMKKLHEEEVAKLTGQTSQLQCADEGMHQLGVELAKVATEREALASQNVELEEKLQELQRTFDVEMSIARDGEDHLQKEIADLKKQLQIVDQEKKEMEKRNMAVRAVHEGKYSPPRNSDSRPAGNTDSGVPTSLTASKE